MITLKRAAAFEAKIKELETVIEAFKNNDLVAKNEELVKQLTEVSNKNNELEGKRLEAVTAFEELKKNFEAKDEAQKVEISNMKAEVAKLKAEAETATEKAVAIVASQGIPMIKLDPDKEEKSDNPFLKTLYSKKR